MWRCRLNVVGGCWRWRRGGGWGRGWGFREGGGGSCCVGLGGEVEELLIEYV